MKYTNALNLPDPIVKAIENDDYDRGEETDYTVTELVDPPRKVALQHQHKNELQEDVADAIFKLLGKSMHKILEQAGVPERRFAITVSGKSIAGKPDRITKEGLVQDWKLTTVYQFQGGEVSAEIHAQLNCYAEILRQNGRAVTRLQAVGVFRDWSKRKAFRERFKGYPQKQVLVVEIPLWPSEHARAYLEARVRLHEAAKAALPECSPGERWARPEIFAVMKQGQKSAVRGSGKLQSRALAEAFIEMQKDKEKLSIEHRPGESVRCGYCAAAPFCDQWKKIQATQKSEPEDDE